MTAWGRIVVAMNTVRRIELAAVLALVVCGLGLAAAGAIAGLAGARLPAAVEGALSAAGAVLGWARVAVAAALVYGVARARENG